MITTAFIPARFDSSRLPGKPLMKIGDKSMIQWVWQKVNTHPGITSTIVLTDDNRIKDHVESFGGNAMITSIDHNSGTERILEVFDDLPGDIFLNVQGDEPMITHHKLARLLDLMNQTHVSIGTLCHPIERTDDLFDYNQVKVVFNKDKRALYFSRQAIPAFRDLPYRSWQEKGKYFSHVGIYGFRREALEQMKNYHSSMLEETESLEQLRWMENGMDIHIQIIEGEASFGIDTEEDLEKVRKMIHLLENQ